MRKKIPLIIGLGQKVREYKSLSKHFRIVQPDWNNGSLSKLRLGKPDILMGFSLGCMIACMHAEKYKVGTLILCSPSPDDVSHIKTNKLVLIMGSEEKWLTGEARRMFKTFKGKKEFIIVKGVGHKITSAYLSAINSALERS